ncbi:PREDICTED: uncharacterized protein LOC109468524 [Branchiostoma belcheri]|uniref:Uncharacterized protein LOC109468524 n=1 Tax=Branchiostoma belcheri TaxID=7741 RepID=A0A6P4YD20_BRABE|nr:PREDICTED: uncharacterized protein LOC109468524 [Branchiostoma belcheri]
MATIPCAKHSFHSSKYISAVAPGDRALHAGDFDKAERIFAQALKAAIRHNNVCLQGLCLQSMGDVYLRRAVKRAPNRRRHFTKAAALYNAALTWAPGDDHWRDVMVHRIKYVEKCFLSWVRGQRCQVSLPYSNDLRHRARLKKIRDECKVLLGCAEKICDFEGDPMESSEVKDKEANWVAAVRSLFHATAGRMKDFVRELLAECRETLGQPPCKYAIIGLGSMAREEMTPYSDFEFAILLEEDKATEQHKMYFRNLTSLLHLKVINLGETILPSMAIRSLNNYYSSEVEDNWLYDWKTPRGFAFDGAMPSASKTPLGRETVDGKASVELIMTPSEMASIQEKQALADEDDHLSDILSTVTWVDGDKSLVDKYQERIHVTTSNSAAIHKALSALFEDAKKYQEDIISLSRPGFQYDVKKEIYRFPTLTINNLGLCFVSKRNTPWDVIDALRDNECVSETGAHNLRVAISVATFLRLQTYLAHGRQKEGITTLLILQQSERKSEEKDLPQKLPISSLLMRFYQTNIPLQMYLFVLAALTSSIPSIIGEIQSKLIQQFLLEHQSSVERTTHEGSMTVCPPLLLENVVSLLKNIEPPYKPSAFSQIQPGLDSANGNGDQTSE